MLNVLIRRFIALCLLTTAGLAAAAGYSSVNLTLQQSMGGLTLGPSNGSSPVMGARNPVIRSGVAYVSASHSSGDWALNLSPKMPLSLTLDRSSGDARLDLRTLKLTRLDINQEMGNLSVMLPATNLMFKLKQSSGNTVIRLPANVGVSVEARSFSSGSITIGGKVVAQGMGLSGTYQSANYETSAYKVQLTVEKSMGDLNIE